MPLYEYYCKCGLVFDRLGSYDDVIAVCPSCKDTAKRRAFYGGEAFVLDRATIPAHEGEYTKEAEKRALKSRGWDYDRSLEHIRNHVIVDNEGRKSLDVRNM